MTNLIELKSFDPGSVGRIEAEYLAGGRGFAWFDGVLKPAALTRLLDFAREATVWYHCRDGYENRRINVTMLYGTRGG